MDMTAEKTMARGWRKAEEGTAIAEFALIFPILFTITLGIWEVGSAIMINQKSIVAAQIVADLVAREMVITDEQLDEAIRAGELAIEPFDLDRYGVDIVSVSYDEDDEPVEVWRETRGMAEVASLIPRTTGLGLEGEGAIAVMIAYEYSPILGGFVMQDDIIIEEVAFSRGRRSAIVNREEEE